MSEASGGQINPEFVAQVGKIFGLLDSLDYFQLLRVGTDADAGAIRSGYHKQSRAFHPDRYHYLRRSELQEQLRAISKRITEAYVILRDDEKRARYLQNIQLPNRDEYLRYVEKHEAVEQQESRDEAGSTAQGRAMYEKAADAHSKGDIAGAIQSLKMAMVYEQDNAAFAELLTRWQQQL